MKKNYELLPKEQKIMALKKKNRILIFLSIFFGLALPLLSIYLLINTNQIDLAIGYLVATPISVGLGGVFPIKENNKKIQALKKEGEINIEQEC